MLSRTRNEDCLSDLRLDELSAGELSVAQRAAALEHLGSCEVCPQRLAELGEARGQLRAELPPLQPLQPLQRPRSRPWLPALGAVVAAAAAVVALFVVPRRAPAPTRIKGSPMLGFYVTDRGATRAGGPGETVRVGDTLIFTASSPRTVYVAVLSRDGAGRASVYHPMTAIEAGAAAVLPVATILDATTGAEHIYGVFCDAAIEVEPLRAALAVRAELPPLPGGCSAETLTIEKRE